MQAVDRPEARKGAGPVLTLRGPEATNLHLNEIGRSVETGAHAVLMRDETGRHGASDLVLPADISLLPLPRCAPGPTGVVNVDRDPKSCTRRSDRGDRFNAASSRTGNDKNGTVKLI